MTTRTDQAQRFIDSSGWGATTVRPLAGDASNRRYDRLTAADGKHAVLMDAPPDKGEDVRPFVQIAEYLTAQGLSAPQIYAQDPVHGFLLIEDLGDRLFAREMATYPTTQDMLYGAAVDVLVHLHDVQPPDLPTYRSDITVPLAALAYDWYQASIDGAVDTAAKTAFSTAFKEVIHPYDAELNTLIQRDYHAENLLWLPDRQGHARVGLLDFQDAMLGHRSYDLVSVLQDARRDVSPDMERAMIDHYINKTGCDRHTFTAAYAVFGLQRNLRILGVFARLCLRGGKAHYVDLIPRVWEHVQTNLRHPALTAVKPVIDTTLVAPTPEILNQLKEKCGTWTGQ
ncbi:MAG: phosphotransferase [Roseobacter sp.]